jgi:16S rRNA (cytosine967-C5)-methyltransferase
MAYKLLCKIEAQRVFSDDALHSESVEQLENRDRNLTTEIVYGTLRWQGLLDHILAAASSRSWQEVIPEARILLRMSVYQMWRMDRIPDHALVNDAVELAKRELGKGIDRYLNGILRRLARTRPWKSAEFLAGAPRWVRVSLPKWLWERWSARYGEAAAAEFALSLNARPQSGFRLDADAGEDLPADAILSDIVPGAAIRIPGPPDGDRSFQILQDEASQLIPHVMGAEPGWRIWDACAAPGGKTAVLLGICGEAGQVIASDLRKERADRIARLLHGTGRRRAALLAADASKPAPFRCSFDAVLADVPCSGLGTLRRNPEIKWHFKPGRFAALQKKQIQILESVSASVREGGRLLYSTCSTEPEENESIVNAFLDAHPEYVLRRPDSPSGIERWIGEDGMVRTFPGTRIWDGFFAALMQRQA